MIKGIYHAAAGMLPRMTQLDTVSNNLANVNTTGFKANRRYFRTTLNNLLLQGGPHGEPIRLSEDKYYLATDFSQGPLVETRNPLDIAINGSGFFVLETGDTESYTRNGNFTINSEGELVNHLNYRVMGEEGPITAVGREVVIRETGEVFVDGRLAGTIRIVDFEEPYRLRRNGYGYFIPVQGSEAIQAEQFGVMQGHLENSNVNPVAEMVRMIELNRSYESCQRAIHAQDETLKLAVNELARSR